MLLATLATVLCLAQMAADLDLISVFQAFSKAVVAGSVPATSFLVMSLVGFVAALRKFGPELERILPDHTLVDRALQWLFKTSSGGWLLNGLSVTGAGLLVPFAADPTKPLTWALVGPILGGAFTLAGVVEFAKDTFFKKPAVAPAPPPSA